VGRDKLVPSRDASALRTVELTIHDIAFGGKGVGRDNGKAVFVPFTIEGETILAEIVREKKQFAEGELVEIREDSPHRVSPPCPYFGRCGGCAYQHIDYDHQLALKWRQVRDILQRIGKINAPPMRPIIPSPLAYAYRNRITVHAEGGIIGFFRRDSHRLIDIERCPISMDEVNDALTALRRRQIPDGHYTLRAEAGPRIFAQANDAVAASLADLIAQMVPNRSELLIDAYCGAGFFAKRLLDKFDRVIGIDWDRFAIAEAKKNATAKETYIAGEVDEALEQARSGGLRTADKSGIGPAATGSMSPSRTGSRTSAGSRRHSLTLIVDPPPTGLTEPVRRAIVNLAPETFVYVSCNPPTLARDLREFQDKFAIESVTPLDMFPQTAEIEVAVHLQA
jgi:tRNA/tmRNA/rRNA uracil-C5-methylase (TrmA/RlmC/RlmD family)